MAEQVTSVCQTMRTPPALVCLWALLKSSRLTVDFEICFRKADELLLQTTAGVGFWLCHDILCNIWTGWHQSEMSKLIWCMGSKGILKTCVVRDCTQPKPVSCLLSWLKLLRQPACLHLEIMKFFFPICFFKAGKFWKYKEPLDASLGKESHWYTPQLMLL